MTAAEAVNEAWHGAFDEVYMHEFQLDSSHKNQ